MYPATSSVKKDDKSHRMSRQFVKVPVPLKKKTTTLAITSRSIDFKGPTKCPTSPVRKSAKPTILRDFVNNQMVLKNDKIAKRTQDSESKFLDRMSIRTS